MRCPFSPGWRDESIQSLSQPWQLIIIGGGITGAGILAIAAEMGLRAVLLEQNDFASGTSSRSSKLVHGGLRYLKQANLKLTRQSVLERQYLLGATNGLVSPLPFLYTIYKRDRVRPWAIATGLSLYTRLASGAGSYTRLSAAETALRHPAPSARELSCAFHYLDAQVDDARLVFRIISDSLVQTQGTTAALNHMRVTGLLRSQGKVIGVAAHDGLTGRTIEVPGRVVINATGAWADEIRTHVGAQAQLRPLRGSHLFFKHSRFPLGEAVAFMHPDDGRPVFAYPWEGVTLLGTTDVDHGSSLDQEPTISVQEADYLFKGVQEIFPELDLSHEDVMSTQAGIRPVVDTGKKNPSDESREHILLAESGLLSVTGGKLTTFRLVAVDALRAARKLDPSLPRASYDIPVLQEPPDKPVPDGLDALTWTRLLGRYGYSALSVAQNLLKYPDPVPETPYLTSEVYWSAENEGIGHLSDLLLRRFRLGILRRDGGRSLIAGLKPIVCQALNWDEARWSSELDLFEKEVSQAHHVPFEWQRS